MTIRVQILLEIESGVTLSITGAETTFTGDGTLTLAGTLQVSDTTLTVDNGFGFNSDGGALTITDGGTADFQDVVDPNVTFVGSGTLELAYPQSYDGIVSGFNTGAETNDVLDLTDIAYTPNETVTWTQSGSLGYLTFANGTTIYLSGTYSQDDFALTQDGGNGTYVVSSPTPAVLTGVDGTGNAVAATPSTVTLTNTTNLSNITYTWLLDGTVVQSGSSDSYTPTIADEGQALDAVVSFKNNGTPEQMTVTAGTVESPFFWGSIVDPDESDQWDAPIRCICANSERQLQWRFGRGRIRLDDVGLFKCWPRFDYDLSSDAGPVPVALCKQYHVKRGDRPASCEFNDDDLRR